MVKKISIAVGILVVVLGLAVFILLMNLNPIVERLRPRLLGLLSESIGQTVTCDSIDLQLFPSTSLILKNVTLPGDTPNSVGVISLQTSIGQLLRGEIAVEQLEISDASLTLVRNEKKQLFLGTVPLQNIKNADTATTQSKSTGSGFIKTANASETNSAPSESVKLALHTLLLNKVSVTFIDKFISPQQNLSLTNLTGRVENLTPHQKGSVTLRATSFSEKADNIAIHGSITLQAGPAGLPLTDIEIEASSLELPELLRTAQSYGVKIQELQAAEDASVNLKLVIDNGGIQVSSEGIDFTDSDIRFGKFFSKPAKTKLRLSFLAQPSLVGAVTGKEAQLNIGSNSITFPFSLGADKSFSSQVKSSNFSLAELAAVIPPLAALEPTGSMDIDVAIKQPAGGTLASTGSLNLSGIGAKLPTGNGMIPVTKLEGPITFKGETIDIPQLDFEVAGQPLRIKATIKELAKPSASWELQSSQLALAPILQAATITAGAAQDATFSQLLIKGSHAGKASSGEVALQLDSGTIQGSTLGKSQVGVTYQLDSKNAPKRIELRPSVISVFGGTANLDGLLSDGSALLSLRANSMQLQPISALALSSSPIQMVGALDFFRIRSRFQQSRLLDTLQGEFEARALEGELQGFNLLRETFGRLGSIPGLEKGLEEYFPPEHAELLKGEATKFDELTLKGGLAEKRVLLEGVTLLHSLYQLSAQGRAGFDGKLDLQAQLKLTPALSEKMVLRQPKLELLLDEGRNLVIPVVIKKEKRFIVIPDVSDLGKRALRNTAKEAVKRELDRAAPGITKELDKVSPGIGKALEGLFK